MGPWRLPIQHLSLLHEPHHPTYDEKSIQLLKGLDAVRKRPGMYIGGTGPEGLHHLVWELIDNAVDEAAAGFANLIEVTLHRDGSVEVADNGRGIPIGRKDGKRTALEVVFTELHAGGKFGTGAYSSSGGLHGVGASVVNALAAKVVAEVDQDGATHRLSFVDAGPGPLRRQGRLQAGSTLEVVKKIPPKRTGTRVRFWPDLEIFDPGLPHRVRAGPRPLRAGLLPGAGAQGPPGRQARRHAARARGVRGQGRPGRPGRDHVHRRVGHRGRHPARHRHLRGEGPRRRDA